MHCINNLRQIVIIKCKMLRTLIQNRSTEPSLIYKPLQFNSITSIRKQYIYQFYTFSLTFDYFYGVCISLTVVYLFIRLRHSYADMVQRSSRFTGAAPLCDRIPIVIMSLTYKSFRRVYLVCILFIYKEHIKQIHHLKSVPYSFDHLNREALQAFAYSCVFH